MKNRRDRFRLLLAALAGFVVSGSIYSTWAGSKLNEPVNVGGAGTVYITGSLGSARNTTNTIEHIGCELEIYTDTPLVTCDWRGASQSSWYRMSSTSDGPFFAYAGASGDSKIAFESYMAPQPVPHLGSLSFIEVYNDSRYRPK